MNQIVYDCRWSSDLDEKFVDDFLRVEQAVFHNGYSRDYFNHKFLRNIYGASVLEVVYIEGRPSAARALWRNDIEGKEAYQPGDTGVLESCRGKGIFTEMTQRAVAMLPSKAIIYNFPNHSSYPGYLKMGWTALHEYGIRLFSPGRYLKEHPIMMDRDYAQWWVMDNGTLSYIKCGGRFFLVRPDRRPLMKHIVACVAEDVAKSFPKSAWGVFFYKSEKDSFYNRHFMKSHVVCKNTDLNYIPTWKVDAL